RETLIRSYGRSFNGFSAKLTQQEIENLKSVNGVVSVFPSRTLELQTTRSWDFLGLPEPTLEQQNVESNIVVGVLDTGIWPESPSFNDFGLSPVPDRWKGVCKGGLNFTCNNLSKIGKSRVKLIGARSYFEDARDKIGHGTHCASVIAGTKVHNTSFYGMAKGTARGGVPSSRIAMYKVCHTKNCSESDILAAFDDAIADGVDLISISIGGNSTEMYSSAIAIGSFHAMAKGILTVQAAGNAGNQYGITGSVEPWIFSVAASSTDRRIVTKLVLGNGTIITGSSINTFTLEKDMYPLVNPTIYGFYKEKPILNTIVCIYSWDHNSVKGKIVVTEKPVLAKYFLREGAIGIVLVTSPQDVSSPLPVPAVLISPADYAVVASYLNSTNPRATILKSETIKNLRAPLVASFSSRGPNKIASDVLKPDISAPGVEILAAYSPIGNVTSAEYDKRRVSYNILSGTSMACPHVAAAAAFVKSHHLNWSPSAIKSALMTSSRPMNPLQNPGGEFAYGSGHINPVAAINPGLVYETTRDDYLPFLCKLSYTKEQIYLISRNKTFTCPSESVGKLTPKDVNYPSMSIKLNISDSAKPFKVEFQRTVTNVGLANSTYTSKVESNNKIKVTVKPNTLSFKSLRERKSFTVTVVGEGLLHSSVKSASLVWSDGVHSVRSPIILY
ncbi:hypothetical protein RND81_01G151600, partial [Saponaria officinalis]